MTKINVIRITLTSFLAYAVMASIMSPLGIVSQPIAVMFDVDVSDATSRFSYITTSIFAGSFLAMFVFDWLKIKVILILNCLFIALSVLSFFVLSDFTKLMLPYVVIGINSGIILTVAAVVITKTFSEGKRASMLLLTDCFYSIGAIFSSFIAAYLISEKNHWGSAYLLTILMVAIIVLLAMVSKYPEDPKGSYSSAELEVKKAEELGSAAERKWPISVYFCAMALFLYILGMVSLYTWLPNYAQSALQVSQESAGQLVSYFFTGMLCSQIVMFFLVLRFPIARLLLISSGVAALVNISLWNISNVNLLPVAVFLLGLFAGGFFKTYITYGTLAIKVASTRLVSFLIFSSGIGTATAPFISSEVVSRSSEVGGLILSSACYLATFVLAAISVYFQSAPARA